MKTLFYFTLTVILFFCSTSFSLEITVPLYDTVSKSINTAIPGSSNIIITKETLKKYKNKPIPEILEKETGIKSRSIYGSNSSGSKTTLDIRGMGAQAKSNVLILINGQRLNNIDMSEIDFPSIPIESIDRIEIFKGNSASVLYGDGAIGGTINIITNPDIVLEDTETVSIKKGTFNLNELTFNHLKGFDNFSINTYFNHIETDGYRDENEQQQNNISSELRYKGDKGNHSFVTSFSEQIMSTPGDRSQDQLFTDRRGSDTPDDFVNSEGWSLFYGSDYKLNENTGLIINGSYRDKYSYYDLQSTSYPSYGDTTLKNYQFTPRINYNSNLLKKLSKSTFGVDIQYADYLSYRKETANAIPLHVYDAWQSTFSLYTQNTIYLNDKTTLGGGLRYQSNSIAIGDHLDKNAPDYGGWQQEHETYLHSEDNTSFNIGIEYELNEINNIFLRFGSGFRYPNIDDRIGGSGGTSLDLKTQRTRDLEIGSKFKFNNSSHHISSYVIQGKNELAYDADSFVNFNMNSTRRYGVELKSAYEIINRIRLENNFTYSKAKYTSGNQGSYATDFEGNDVPLVPEYSIDTKLDFIVSDTLNFSPSIKYQDDMRMESDDENFQNTKIPAYIITNLDINKKFKNLLLTLSINNLFNEKYHNYAVASSNTNGTYNSYPMPEREFIIKIESNF